MLLAAKAASMSLLLLLTWVEICSKTQCFNSCTDLSTSQAILLGKFHFVHLDLIFHKLIDVDCGLQ